jgi:copper transport protein
MRARAAWKATRVVLALAFSIAITPGVSHAHAALLKSSPRAGSSVGSELTQVRLAFSEEVVPDLCHVAIMGPRGSRFDLRVAADPHDVRALVAPVSSLAPGEYHVMWHVVSADGHPREGAFRFSVVGPPSATVAVSPTFTRPADTAVTMSEEPTSNPFPVFAAASKGIGLTALLALAGALVFSMGHGGGRVREYRRWEIALAAIATVGLVIHVILWSRYVMAPAGFTGESLFALFARGPGRMEMIRVVLVVSAMLALLLELAPALVLVPAGLAVAITAMMGHPAAEHAAISIPLILAHLFAVAIWTGGLVSLLVVRNVEPSSFRVHASFVSTLAFIAVVVVSLTGAAESLVLLTSPADLIRSAYGRWILVKVAGLFILVIFGWHHRFRALPALTNDETHGMTLSLRMETAVMAATIIAAAFLSYTPLPR